MRGIWGFCLIGLWMTFSWGKEMVVKQNNSYPDVLVGVNYFAGWWEPLPNKWHVPPGFDWRSKYPERIPLLGAFNTQEVMDQEIIAASDHGVDFFNILWYYNPPEREREPNASFLNRGVSNFIHSSESNRMKFMIEFCNHPPYDVESDADWHACVEQWMPSFKHPSYLRVGGKMVMKIHSSHGFWMNANQDRDLCLNRLELLRRTVREAGLGELLIGCGVDSSQVIAEGNPLVGMFDFTNTYMAVPACLLRDEPYPYKDLAAVARKGRRDQGGSKIPSIPYLPAGWYPRPWGDPRPDFYFPNAEEWEEELHDMAEDLHNLPNLGLPDGTDKLKPIFTIYAWNEFGEGGIVAPTQGEGWMKLTGIKKVFGE